MSQKTLRNLIGYFLFLATIAVLVFSSQLGYAQPGGGGDPCPGGPPCNPDVPISGIEFLITGGLLIAWKKLMKRDSNKSE